MLAHDITRCDPEYPDHYCWNCKRFIKHPKQVPGKSMVSVETSQSEACMYMPITLQGPRGSVSPGLQGRLSRH